MQEVQIRTSRRLGHFVLAFGVLGARLVTRDRKLHAFDGVETVW